MPYVLSPAADDDAFEIIRGAVRINRRYGRALDAELDDLLERIGENPGIGALKPTVTPRPAPRCGVANKRSSCHAE